MPLAPVPAALACEGRLAIIDGLTRRYVVVSNDDGEAYAQIERYLVELGFAAASASRIGQHVDIRHPSGVSLRAAIDFMPLGDARPLAKAA